ncbi:hypothetical protein HRbin33_00588 [bacterium HR33]|nr:hypothetical protein HRbin33_00588 [bacterium HR33]
MLNRSQLSWSLLALSLNFGYASAQEPQGQDTTELARLRAQIEAITRELEELRLGREVVARADSSILGFGPAASKVYRGQEGVSLGGYGEVLYENFSASRQDGQLSGRTDQLDALRAIVYVGYKFNDRLIFNSEIEFEHAHTGQGGVVEMEFAYVDYRISPQFGLRAGLLLLPLGILNEQHEPPTFFGARRTDVETAIIPSTWRENGIGVFGSLGDLSYRAYLVNGFDAVGGGSSRAGGFSASGLRGGRQSGARAIAEDFALALRADYTGVLGLTLGAGTYYGEAGQGRTLPAGFGSGTLDAPTYIWELHALYQARGLDLRALYVRAGVGDVAALNAARGLTGSASIGERLEGWYLQAGYDILRGTRSAHQLAPFVRYEKLNTQARVPAGFTADPANDQRIVTLGLSWKPIFQVALKADYQIRRNQARTAVNQFNAAISYLF